MHLKKVVLAIYITCSFKIKRQSNFFLDLKKNSSREHQNNRKILMLGKSHSLKDETRKYFMSKSTSAKL